MKRTNFEDLLQQQYNNTKIGTKKEVEIAKKELEIKPQKSDKGASLPEFIDMVCKLVTKTTRENKTIFMMDEGNRPIMDPSQRIEGPHIYYQVISRTPSKELKPREREEFKERSGDQNSDRYGRVLGQKFDCTIQFDIMTPKSVKTSIDGVMTNFEDMMLMYSHYFKKNGVVEILFKKQLTDHNLDSFRQIYSVRSLQYHVVIEKLTLAYDGEIFAVNDNSN